MRRVRPIGFEALEGRLLLSSAHVGAHHARRGAGTGPVIMLNGTLTVDARSASTTQNAAGGMTTTMTVAGQLSTNGRGARDLDREYRFVGQRRRARHAPDV
jgi:hypothetical protein